MNIFLKSLLVLIIVAIGIFFYTRTEKVTDHPTQETSTVSEETSTTTQAVNSWNIFDNKKLTLVEGNKYTLKNGYTYTQQTLRIVSKDGTTKDIYSIDPVEDPMLIHRVEVSPSGTYALVVTHYWEASAYDIFNLKTGKAVLDKSEYVNILEDRELDNGPSVVWSPNEEFAAFVTYYYGLDGSGENAIYLFYPESKASRITPIFKFGGQESETFLVNENVGIEKIVKLSADKDFIYFTARDRDRGDLIEYFYNTVTRSLVTSPIN